MTPSWVDRLSQALGDTEKALSATSRFLETEMPVYYDLQEYGVIDFQGPDLVRFLQGQLSVDIQQVTDGQSKLAAFCNPQGRIRALMLLVCHPTSPSDHLLAIVPKEMIANTVDGLKKYAVFFNVQITDASQQWVVSGVRFPELHSMWKSAQWLDVIPFQSMQLVRWSSNRWLAILPSNTDEHAWNEAAAALPYRYWLADDIRTGLPRLFEQTQESFLPHNLDLPNLGAVNFTKGCYTGQEVVARMHYKGTLKSHLRCLKGTSSEIPLPGSALTNGQKKLGTVVAASCVDQTLWILALCQDSIENETNIQCSEENTSILELSAYQRQYQE